MSEIVKNTKIEWLDIAYLLLSEKLCVYHFDLDRDQSERLKCQTSPVSVVVLQTQKKQFSKLRIT